MAHRPAAAPGAEDSAVRAVGEGVRAGGGADENAPHAGARHVPGAYRPKRLEHPPDARPALGLRVPALLRTRNHSSKQAAMNEKMRSRLEVIGAFLKLGALGFGAPAIWALIQAEVQERRGWLTKERYLEGLALVNALPGAPAMQMCIFAGHQRAGMLGGLLAGFGFMAPSFAIMLLLSAAAASYGALPLMRDAFYG